MGLTLLLGGTRSGKSRVAVGLARQSGTHVVVIATAEPRDDDMAERIRRHRADRPPHWETVEEPTELESALRRVPLGTTVLIDCLTLWLSNLMERNFSDVDIEDAARSAAAFAASRSGATIVVSNEVGSGIVPANAIARRYADLLGQVNTVWADAATQSFLVVAGRVLPLAAPGAISAPSRGPS
jgi:adenosyl cobinamide kinase/adenosyl cobinamide phosphate guanylyltransferase